MKIRKIESVWLGYGALFLAVALFSTIEIASKMLSWRSRVDPFCLVFLRFFVTALVLLSVSVRSWRPRAREFGYRDWGIFLLNGLVGITLSISLFHFAILAFHNASSSAVVFSANPVFVTVFARFINGEGWTVKKWIAVILGCMGVASFVWESGSPTSAALIGMVLMGGSAALFGLSICISRRYVGRYGPVPFMGISSLFGSLAVLPLALARMTPVMIGEIRNSWILVGYICLVGTALAYGAYYFGLSRTSAYQASMAFFLKPVLASVLSVLWLSERLNVWTVCGTVLILSGLALSLIPSVDSVKRILFAEIRT